MYHFVGVSHAKNSPSFSLTIPIFFGKKRDERRCQKGEIHFRFAAYQEGWRKLIVIAQFAWTNLIRALGFELSKAGPISIRVLDSLTIFLNDCIWEVIDGIMESLILPERYFTFSIFHCVCILTS
jgi:hypothetical protein